MSIFKYILNYLHNTKKQETLNYLQGMQTRQLIECGFSPKLINQGVSAWPWRLDDQPEELLSIELMIGEEQRCIAELNRYTDSELADLQLSHGFVRHTVRHGRPGIDNHSTRRVA